MDVRKSLGVVTQQQVLQFAQQVGLTVLIEPSAYHLWFAGTPLESAPEGGLDPCIVIVQGAETEDSEGFPELQLSEWAVTAAGQTTTVFFPEEFEIANLAAPDLFGPAGPGSSPDFLSDDFLRVVGARSVNGMSEYFFTTPFKISSGQVFDVDSFTVTAIPPPLPESISAVPDDSSLTVMGQATQVRVTATLNDGTMIDVTPHTSWTTYRTSNRAVVTVDQDGLVMAMNDGTAFITAGNEGATAVTSVIVSFGDPGTTVVGFVQLDDGSPVNGADVDILGQPGLATVSGVDGSYSIPNVLAQIGPIRIRARVTIGGMFLTDITDPITPVAGGITDGGILVPGQSNREVLILWDVLDSRTQALADALSNAGFVVTLSPTVEYQYNGMNPPPDIFGAIVHLNGTTYFAGITSSGQAALVNYVQNGGGFIHAEWNAFEVDSQGSQTAMAPITLLRRDSGNGGFNLTLVDVPSQASHPILANVPSPLVISGFGVTNSGFARVFASEPSIVLMQDTAGNDAVVIREYGVGRVVGFHHAGNYSGSSFLVDPSVQALYVDAALWVTGVTN